MVAGIRLSMAKAIFPYLHRYSIISLADAWANIILAAQAQRDAFLFHLSLTKVNGLPQHRSHGLGLDQVLPIKPFEFGELLHRRWDHFHVVFHYLPRKIPENRRFL
jgi:hypothetical protein